MIGQERLKQEFANFTLSTLPKTMLFMGQEGCGKHLFIKELADKLNLMIREIEVTPDLDDKLNEYQANPVNTVYIINMSKISQANQNRFLKFIEEPGKNAWIAIFVETLSLAIDTVVNRCQKYSFDNYTKDELKKITNTDYEDFIYDICKTPGELMKVNLDNLKACQELCSTMVKKLNKASYQNTMSIITKLNFKDEYDKIDPTVFLNILKKTAFEEYEKTDSKLADTIYQCISIALTAAGFAYGTLNKKWYITSVLSKLWEATR